MTYHHKIVFLHQTDYSNTLFLSRRFCSSPLGIYSPKVLIRFCTKDAMEIQSCNNLQVFFFAVAEFFLLPSWKILFIFYLTLVVHKYFHYAASLKRNQGTAGIINWQFHVRSWDSYPTISCGFHIVFNVPCNHIFNITKTHILTQRCVFVRTFEMRPLPVTQTDWEYRSKQYILFKFWNTLFLCWN